MVAYPEYFPVIFIEEKALIGHIVFHKYFNVHTYQIGWVFHLNYYNRGFATEAAEAVISSTVLKNEVTLNCHNMSTAECTIISGDGEERVEKRRLFKKCIPNRNEWRNGYYYTILAEEWE